MNERVVLTGLGVVAPNGIGRDAFWQALLRGHCGVGPITLFDTSAHRVKIAGEVRGFDLNDYFTPRGRVREMARQTQFALAAAVMALADGRMGLGRNGNRGDVPVILGVSTSAMDIIEQGMKCLQERGPGRVPTYIVAGGQPQQAASVLAAELGFPTRSETLASACQAGIDAIIAAYDVIRHGKAEMALAGGADAPISPLTFACIDRAGLSSCYPGDPGQASRPFDLRRDSGVISEGSCILILESLDHARARGVTPWLEFGGYGKAVDPDEPQPGSGLALSMRQALANAGRRPEDIDYICAHGPGHPVLDRVETAMIKKVFGEHARRIPVSSIKGSIGNPLAAAGPMQVAACACSARDGMIPPTANLEEPDPECDLDYVPGACRSYRWRDALINVHGLGGGNTSLVVRTLPEQRT